MRGAARILGDGATVDLIAPRDVPDERQSFLPPFCGDSLLLYLYAPQQATQQLFPTEA